jgi:hypothetical protein
MRRPLMLIALVFTLGIGIQSAADAALYRGVGKSTRVEFRVERGKVTFARVRTKLHCVRNGGEFRRAYGEAFFPGTSSDGSFEEDFATEEPGYSQEYELTGKVRYGQINGRFEYEQRYSGRSDQICRASFGYVAILQTGTS